MSLPVNAICRVMLSTACLAAATACTTVFETTSENLVEGVACRTTAGAYYLPKALVRIAIAPNAGGRGFRLDKATPTFQYVADRHHPPYCLDYLASPTSKDIIAVNRTNNGLLQKVFSNIEDRSAEIAFKLIDTAELLTTAALRSGQFDAAGTQETADFTFDPFNPVEMTEINKALRRFGFCVYIENHSFPDDTVNPQTWCSDPMQERYVNAYNVMLATTPVIPELMNAGILYRPSATHKLVIRRKNDPTGREPWALLLTKHVEMPNVSPIFSIGVYRALFATRKTELTFASGILTNVKIDKTSELESFSRIPLRIAQAVVNIPTEIIQLRINDVTDQTTLANKQMELIVALATLNKTTAANPAAVATIGVPPGQLPDRLQQLMQFCLQQGGTPDFCKTKIAGPPQ